VSTRGAAQAFSAEGSVDDFDTEFNSLWRRAYGVAYVVLGDRDESEDIAQ
jgi:hypothetical protein